MIGLRKYCVLRFTPTYLHIISASLNEPQVWAKVNVGIFDTYEVDSTRDNIISLELNVDSLYNVLRSFDKGNSGIMQVQLQRRLANDINKTNDVVSKKLASLAITYTEIIENLQTNINNSFKIPVRLLKKESDDKILEPELDSVDLLLRLPKNISSLFKRIERFKRNNLICINGTMNGNLSLILNDDDLKVELSWNEKLSVQTYGDLENVRIFVQLKDWRFGMKCCEICANAVLIFSEPGALVLHCYLDDNDEIEIAYYINGVSQG